MSNRRLLTIKGGAVVAVENVDAFGAFNGKAAKVMQASATSQGGLHSRMYKCMLTVPGQAAPIEVIPYIEPHDVASYCYGTPGWYANFAAGILLHACDDFGNLIELSAANLIAATEFILAGAAHDAL